MNFRPFKAATSLAIAVIMGLLFASSAQALQLKPYKDKLFAYPGILESKYGGAFLRVDYDEMRDINGRDAIPQRKVQSKYVSRKPNWSQTTQKLTVAGKKLQYVAVGKTRGKANMIVIYIHGRGGNRHQGVNDVTFGGNFNRIKNLMHRNGGLYLSPDFSDFEKRGRDEIRALITHSLTTSPNAKVFVACGSMGGEICWQFLADSHAASLVDGLLFLGSHPNEKFFSSPVFKAPSKYVPLYFGHGTNDSVFDWEDQAQFFLRVKSFKPDYPIRLVLFETGSHGTPIRMTDWRDILNWMLARR